MEGKDFELLMAMQTNHTNPVEIEELVRLVREGADVHAMDGDRTFLHEAARYGNPGNMEWLIEQDFRVNEETDAGDRPLHEAARGGELVAMQYLAEHGAVDAINNVGMTAEALLEQHHSELVPVWASLCETFS